MKTVIERFIEKVEITDTCWLWTAAKKDQKGYGAFGFEGRIRRAHQVIYEIMHGPIPEGGVVCHICDVKSCVNPFHLYLGTNSTNVQDCWDRGNAEPWRQHLPIAQQVAWEKKRNATHCQRGHSEWYILTDGTRRCRACQREWKKKQRAA